MAHIRYTNKNLSKIYQIKDVREALQKQRRFRDTILREIQNTEALERYNELEYMLNEFKELENVLKKRLKELKK